MANNFKNTTLVTKLAIKHFINALILGQKVDRQLDSQFRKVGDTIYVRRPIMFDIEAGATLSTATDIQERTVPVQLANYNHTWFEITSQDETLSVEDMEERYIKPAMYKLAQQVDIDIAANYKYISNFVGTAGTTPSTFLDVARAKALMAKLGTDMEGDWCAFFNADASIELANGLKGVFPQEIAKKAIENAKIGRYSSFDMYESNLLATHTVGVSTGTPLVDGADQDVTYATSGDTWTQTLVTNGWTNDTTGILKAGDVFTIEGVNSVNRRSKVSTGTLQQFVVTADANSGASTGPSTLTISPPIIDSGPYQTVTAAPANDAPITVITGAGGASHPQNLAWAKNAITLAFAPLDVPTDGASGSRQDFMGCSIRAVRQFDIVNDKTIFRFDTLYGIKVQNPDMACRITG